MTDKAKKPRKPAAKRKAKPAPAARPPGRPTRYHPALARVAAILCERGATTAEVADALDVNISTVKLWAVKHPEFSAALMVAKAAADDRVERSLYERAVGFEVDAVKVMQHLGQPLIVPYRERIAPDPGACKLWLANRRPDRWRAADRIEATVDAKVDATVRGDVDLSAMSPAALNELLVALGVSEAANG